MMNKRILGIAALVAASMGLGSAEPYRAQLPESREPPPVPPRAKREPAPFDAPRWARKRKAKQEAEARRKKRKAGISGAKLWRKGGGLKTVRGW